ncbi:MAG: amino acid ABC transporter permease [Bacillota bacterium]|nr:amino acid ABC transporter permease [Bacillota bacterium]MDD3298169.1 amino acid ABC transporter permease [Bacillota bacterium]MDD4707943.1 amino acid ABC transporter permease [Bacillota bacterium]
MIDIPWDFTVIPSYFPRFYGAAWLTLQITVLGILLGLVLGLITALMRISRSKIIQGPALFYIWIIRGTPLLLQLFIIYFGLVEFVDIPRLTSAVIGLGVHNGAYMAEIFRGAIQSIDRGQKEAAYSLGMTKTKAMRRIILPQAFKRSVPPLGNQFIIALKDSSLASAVSVRELLLTARQIGSSTMMMLEMFVVVGVYYLLMTSVLTVLVGKLEKRLKVSDRRS